MPDLNKLGGLPGCEIPFSCIHLQICVFATPFFVQPCVFTTDLMKIEYLFLSVKYLDEVFAPPLKGLVVRYSFTGSGIQYLKIEVLNTSIGRYSTPKI